MSTSTGAPTGSPTGAPTGTPTEAGYTESTEGRVYTVSGGDWDEIVTGAARSGEERMVVNMGPQHPSTHGVLRLVLELDGETVEQARVIIGYLHTGIEKNLEYRTWTQAVTFLTRADYLAPVSNETAFCLGVEKLLDITVPRRAQLLRVLMAELNRISSHLVWLATSGMEIGALSMMLYGFREREIILDIFEMITGLRMNLAYVRPGGVATDLPPGAIEKIQEFLDLMPHRIDEYEDLLTGNTIWQLRQRGIGVLDAQACIALGVTGPMLRAAGIPWDLRKEMPYSCYEEFDFDVITRTEGDCWARYEVRIAEMRESLKIVAQVLTKLEPGPIMVEDKKIGWPAQLALGGDGLGTSLDHVKKIMGTSMEALIHHFKLVTEGFRVPPGQVYSAVEGPRGELGNHIVSDGGTRPFRVHVRDPSFINLQAASALVEGSYIADAIASLASLDPVLGGVDR